MPWAFYAGHRHIHNVNACTRMEYVRLTAVDIERGGNFAFSNKNFVRITAKSVHSHTHKPSHRYRRTELALFVNIAAANAFNFQQSISKHCRGACTMHRPTDRTNQVSPFIQITFGNVNNARNICNSEAVCTTSSTQHNKRKP